jgi:hypothetical protein
MTAPQRRDRELYARPMRRLCACILGVMLLTQGALALYAWSLAGQRFLPALERKAQTIAEALAARQARAIDQGGAPAPVPGAAWDAILAQHPDLAYITLTDAAGKVLYRGGSGAEIVAPEAHLDTRAEIVHRFLRHGQVHVGVARGYLPTRMEVLRPELAVLLVASLLIAFEALWLAVTLHCSAPLRQAVAVMSQMAAGDFRWRAGPGAPDALGARLDLLAARINAGFRALARRAAEPGQQAVGAIVLRRLRARYRFCEDGAPIVLARQRIVSLRLLAFLGVFATLLAQASAPYHLDAPGLAGAALPACAFLLGLGATLPWARRCSERAGRRRACVGGALAAAAAMACAGAAPGLATLALARAGTGAGMALMLGACHGHLRDHADASGHARGMAMLAGGAALAALCAPAAGALLADHLGHAWTSLAGAAVAVLAAAVAATQLDHGVRARGVPAHAPGPRRAAGAAVLLALPYLAVFAVALPLAGAGGDGGGPWPWLGGALLALPLALAGRIGAGAAPVRQAP